MFGAKMSWCRIVWCQMSWRQIVRVPNYPFLLSWCQIIRCQIVLQSKKLLCIWSACGMIFSCEIKMKNGFGIEGEKGVEAEELLTSKICGVEQPATSWKLKTDHFPGDFAQVSTFRLNLTQTSGSDPIDGPWKLTVGKRSWEEKSGGVGAFSAN